MPSRINFSGIFSSSSGRTVGAFSPDDTSGIPQSRPGSFLVAGLSESDVGPISSSHARVRSRSFGCASVAVRGLACPLLDHLRRHRSQSFGSAKNFPSGLCFIHSALQNRFRARSDLRLGSSQPFRFFLLTFRLGRFTAQKSAPRLAERFLCIAQTMRYSTTTKSGSPGQITRCV
jgi:hypothetical protein